MHAIRRIKTMWLKEKILFISVELYFGQIRHNIPQAQRKSTFFYHSPQFIGYSLKSAKMEVIGDLRNTMMNSKLIRMPVDNLKKVYNMMPNLPELEMKRRNYGKLTLIFLGLFLGGCLISFYLYYVILDFEIRRVGWITSNELDGLWVNSVK